jgi:hypothetical protein
MAAPLKLTPDQIIDAVRRTHGMISHAAARLRCDRDTVHNYAKRFPAVAAAIREARERTLDIAELALYEAIKAGEPWAVMFYLRTQGKARGYSERYELTGADGESWHIHLTWTDGRDETDD